MKVLAALALCLALTTGGGCRGLDQRFVKTVGDAFEDYSATADQSIERDETLTPGRKKVLQAESAEIRKTLKAAKR